MKDCNSVRCSIDHAEYIAFIKSASKMRAKPVAKSAAALIPFLAARIAKTKPAVTATVLAAPPGEFRKTLMYGQRSSKAFLSGPRAKQYTRKAMVDAIKMHVVLFRM